MREGGWIHRPPQTEGDVEGETIRTFLKVRKMEMQSQMDSLTQALHSEMQERMLAEQLCQEIRARAREEEVKHHLDIEGLRKDIAEMAAQHETVLVQLSYRKLDQDDATLAHNRSISQIQLSNIIQSESTQRESTAATETAEYSNLKRIQQLEADNTSLRNELNKKEIDEGALQEFLRSKKADMTQRLEEEVLSKRVLASKLASRDSELDDARQNVDELMKELNGYQRLQQQAVRLQSKSQIAEETLGEVRRQHLSTKAELNRLKRSHEDSLEKHQSELDAQQLTHEEEQAKLKGKWEKTDSYAEDLESLLKTSRSETTQLKEQIRATAYSMQEGLSANLRSVEAISNTPTHLQAPAVSNLSYHGSNNNSTSGTTTSKINIMDGVYIPVPRESHPAPPPPTPLFNTVISQNKLEFDTPELV